LAHDAKDRSLRDGEKRVSAADKKLATKADEAARALDETRRSALDEIEGLASEAAREIVAKLTGAKVDDKSARAAVAGALSRA
jgi:F-type H+-transporting ATPase subunit b